MGYWFLQAHFILTLVIKQLIESLPSFKTFTHFLGLLQAEYKMHSKRVGKLSNYRNPKWLLVKPPLLLKLNIIRITTDVNPLMQCERKIMRFVILKSNKWCLDVQCAEWNMLCNHLRPNLMSININNVSILQQYLSNLDNSRG